MVKTATAPRTSDRKNWRLVKVATTKAQRKLFFNLRGMKQRLGWMNRSEVEAVARELKVKPEEVLEMESRLAGQDVSFKGASIDGEDSYGPEDFRSEELAARESRDDQGAAQAVLQPAWDEAAPRLDEPQRSRGGCARAQGQARGSPRDGIAPGRPGRVVQGRIDRW